MTVATKRPPAESAPPVLAPEQHVLSTLEADGSRRWLTPKLARGPRWKARRAVAYGLIAIYSALPWVEVNGRPAIRFDLPGRELTVLGQTFLATDTAVVALGVLIVFLSIFLATALLGRVWCGWACPQTVYMEFLFRPIERLFMGRARVGGASRGEVAPWRRLAMAATFVVVCAHLAQTFLAYFVGAKGVSRWMLEGPAAHPAGFAVVAAVTLLMLVDFGYWREQMCILGCPYGRLQSVLLDRDSTVVAYDECRGEPRGARRKSEARSRLGDCVDCNLCVQVCPTGIDIRDGLQLECIHCAQCADACDHVMGKVGRPKGLVRYSTQARDAGEAKRLVRPRTTVYSGLVFGLLVAFGLMVGGKGAADVTLLRSLGHPFAVLKDGTVDNTMRVKVTNRAPAARAYTYELLAPAGADLRGGLKGDRVPSGSTQVQPLHVIAPRSLFRSGSLDAQLRVSDGEGWEKVIEMRLLGPRSPMGGRR